MLHPRSHLMMVAMSASQRLLQYIVDHAKAFQMRRRKSQRLGRLRRKLMALPQNTAQPSGLITE